MNSLIMVKMYTGAVVVIFKYVYHIVVTNVNYTQT